jgi:hypothetical protein
MAGSTLHAGGAGDAVERQRERRRESTTNPVVTTLIPLDELDAVGF